MTTPSDSAIAQAFREALAAYDAKTTSSVVIPLLERRAREIDAAQPAAAGELPEAVAWWNPSSEEVRKYTKDQVSANIDMLIKHGWQPLYTADQLRAAVAGYRRDAENSRAEAERLNSIINTPQADDFLRAVSTEAEHQRQRWGSGHDAGKEPSDWFWLIGYLAGKALHAHVSGNVDKAEHHIITTAAACANWHRAVFGKTDMRPGIDGDAALANLRSGDGKEG